MTTDKYYLAFTCSCHTKGAIVATTLKGVIGSYADTYGKHDNVHPRNLWLGSPMEKPAWYDAALEEERRREELRRTFYSITGYMTHLGSGYEKEQLIATGLLKWCPNRKFMEEQEEEGCEWECRLCLGFEVVPFNCTWEEMHERKKTLDSLNEKL